ncbi:uncharacterized protein LOC110985416 [Acanthaster planci]|uniref:Uncharacterized protein LOC110985416 n=1 Tax=Acanthaster planci TaxID=133434 RepID=A0A8B7ZAW7_ACAPL|nr:uncharacterized protein LOC110985416 [Acanthaster planci]
MDKSLLLLLLVAVATSYAQKKCCFPNQFEGSVGTLTGTVMGGQGSVTNAVHQYAFDYTNKRLATIAYKENMGQQTKYQNIFDYNKEIEYEIQILPQISVCLVHHLPPGTNMTHSIPDSAAYLGSSYYGNHQLNVDIFQYYQPKGDFVGNVTITVSQEECVPISLVQQGQNNNGM